MGESEEVRGRGEGFQIIARKEFEEDVMLYTRFNHRPAMKVE